MSQGLQVAEDEPRKSETLARLLLALDPGSVSRHSEFSSSLSNSKHAARMVPGRVTMSDPSRREAILGTIGAAAVTLGTPVQVLADEPQRVVVAGATGQTGRRVLERLASKGGLTVIGGVRNVAKAKEALDKESVAVRGAMIQSVPSVDTSAVTLSQLDVEKQDVPAMTETLKGASALVVAVGFVPGNPFKMNAAAHAVDNVGTIKLIDAAKAAGVSKVVLVSSILTDAGAWDQRGSAGFQVTNAFGQVLDEKLVAEKYLRQSGLDYTIVRPGGLKAQPPSGNLVISGENTLNSGEISRDTVADVCVAAVFDSASKNKVVEIFESEEAGVSVPPKDKWFYGLKM
jgi:nucleoside-diphosphate-sugar epimerase